MSSVAASPSSCASGQISPTSRPTLSGLLTPTPTSSNRGCLTISGITILPTKPVPQTTTRFAPDSFTAFTIGGLAIIGGQVREPPTLSPAFSLPPPPPPLPSALPPPPPPPNPLAS